MSKAYFVRAAVFVFYSSLLRRVTTSGRALGLKDTLMGFYCLDIARRTLCFVFASVTMTTRRLGDLYNCVRDNFYDRGLDFYDFGKVVLLDYLYRYDLVGGRFYDLGLDYRVYGLRLDILRDTS